jgi:hypothetical protein
MRRAIMLFLDGLRRDMVSEALTPELAAHARRSERCAAHRSMFPSATRVVSASLATGCFPSRHELQGNSLALLEHGRLVAHDAGHPEFLQHKRRTTGRSLAVPTIAERVKESGGAVIYANVSPGAAYAHDPDGHGVVYHRAGSFGAGRKPIDDAPVKGVQQGIAGDRLLAERFIEGAVFASKPAFAALWLSEPDLTQHAVPLGSPEHLAVLAAADAIAGQVIGAVEKARRGGDDILLLVGSDHGHQTVRGVIDIEAELVAAGLKEGPGSDDVLAISSGTAALVYVHESLAGRTDSIGAFLERAPWAGRVIGARNLGEVGQTARHGLAFAVAMAASDACNGYGVPGLSYEAKPLPGKADHLGCGQHGGLGTFEQMPFLLISGPGFTAGHDRPEPTSAIDIAPTVLRHLGLPEDGLDGRALQS